MRRIAFFALWCALLEARSFSFHPPIPTDIFNNDLRTRTLATPEQLRWTVSLGGCTGSMLSPRFLLTAHHCNPSVGAVYTSGACLEMGCKGDLKVTRVTERFTNFDSDIVEVQWNRLDSRWRQRYTPRVQTQDSDIVLGKDGTGTQLFTVGFPGDKQKSMYAVGYAKELQGDFLNYNVASINGNSGGAVWTTEDYMLVSQTNHGPHQLGQPGWNNNDPEDKEAWNGGPRVNRLYDASATLREIFPSGTNPDISREGYLVWDETLPPLDP